MTRNHIVAVAVAVGVAATGVGVGLTLTGGDATTSPSKASTQSGSVLTGKPGEAGRVLAVKIDNVGPARPATGLNQAAVVYGVQVEGGLSRLVAVFDDNHPVPDTVGPVRSARETDLQLLPQFGNPNLAYSGAQSKLKRDLDNNPDINTVKNGYYRSERPAPHNQYLRTGGAFAGADKANDVGFRFGPRPGGGTPTDLVRVQYPSARFSFTWEGGRYAVWMDGVRTPWRTDNVVVQDVDIVESKYSSRTGYVPYSRTVGSGASVVHRDGVAHAGKWTRLGERSGTTYEFNGKRINFKPGNTWVILK